jgi:flavin-dependent dehydrogenase
VIVIGGGPAGAAAALNLAPRVRVLVVEKDRSPREKPCGGALSAKSLRELATLGLPPLEEGLLHPLGISSTTRFLLGSREVIHCHLPVPFVSRRELDGLLLRRAEERGAEVMTGVRVVGLEVEDEECRVRVRREDEGGREEVFRASVAIGADGAGGWTSLFSGNRGVPMALAIEAPTGRRGEEIEIFLEVREGYAWYFPHFEGGQYGVFSRSPRETLAAWQRLSSRWSLSGPPRGRYIAAFPRPLLRGRLLLAGDGAA